MLRLSSLSSEYLRISVQADEAGVAVDPTGDAVYFAFIPGYRNPGALDWVAGSWDVTALGLPLAQCLVGPEGATALSPGPYFVWLRLEETSETIIRNVGQIMVE